LVQPLPYPPSPFTRRYKKEGRMSTIDEAKVFLKKDSAGSNLYNHLGEIIREVLNAKPQGPLDLFESISAEVKDKTYCVKDTIDGESLPGQGAPSEEKSAQIYWSESAAGLFKAPEGFDEADQKVQDWAADSAMLEWAGVSFGQAESHRLALSLKHLAASANASELRLWGKITGTKSDYYIAEGNTGEGVESPVEDDKEPKKSMDYYECAAVAGEGYRIGANAHTYWVCSYAGGNWVKLPDVTCKQIVISRSLRKIFSGDLDAQVNGYPNFPGTEKNYLRAIIARISSDTVIVPENVFQKGVPEDIEAEDEANLMIMPVDEMDTEAQAVEEVADPAKWMHLELGLNKIGRATPFPTDPEQEDAEENPDAELAGEGLRAVAEEEDYEAKYIKKVCGSFAVIRNMKWPGAYAAANQKSYANIYVGNGVEFLAKRYKPALPPSIMQEWKPNEEDLPGEGENAYYGAVLKFHPEAKIQFDPNKEEEVDDE